MPTDPKTQGAGAAERLNRLALEAFQLNHPEEVPRKLRLTPAAWTGLLAYLADGEPRPAPAAETLRTVYQALRAAGAGERYLAVMAGVRFPLTEAGSCWARQLGPSTPAESEFHHALGKLRWDQAGLWLRRRVAIADQEVAWAIAGLLPTGETLRLAVRVRPEPTQLEALAEDLSDDAVAAAGFEVIGFRDWQLRFPGSCALHVARFCRHRAPGLALPARLVDPDDDHPVHRAQATPTVLTPRPARPNWTLREALRSAHPDASAPALLQLYHTRLLDRTAETAEGEEWILSG